MIDDIEPKAKVAELEKKSVDWERKVSCILKRPEKLDEAWNFPQLRFSSGCVGV